MRELIARINRIFLKEKIQKVKVGDIEFDIDKMEVYRKRRKDRIK